MMWPRINALASDVQASRRSAVSLVQQALQAIEKQRSFNCVLALNEQVLEQARAIDQRVRKGERIGPLAGVPYLAKDNYLTKGVVTTAGSRILEGFIPPFNATVIERLEQAGALMVGKTNMDAFAHGSSNENSDYGPVKHPLDRQRVPGGSSGGSATAVRLDIVPFALGTDTGGSIRQPASFCGIVGLKPTYGLVSRYGVVAMASSTDVMGPLARSVEDAAAVLKVIAGRDPLDSTSMEYRSRSVRSKAMATLKGVKVGVIEEFVSEGLAKGVAARFEAAIELLRRRGVNIQRLSVPAARDALSVYYVIVPAEISSNLGRYDGIRYGPRATAADLETTYIHTRTKGFNSENRRRIIIGTYVLSSGYYDAYYHKAQQARTVLINEFDKALHRVDFLLGPTTPTTAFRLGEKSHDPVAMYMSDVLTVAPNLTGSPAISLPVGDDEQGLPVGLQVIAARGQDQQLLAFAQLIEQEQQQ